MHPLPRVIEEAAFGLFHRRFSDLCRAATPCASQSKGLPQIWCQKWDKFLFIQRTSSVDLSFTVLPIAGRRISILIFADLLMISTFS
ncbi:Hypothetical predicted protein [Cloeon dipterum]|uniref:Uncharacterized protein n=1 Tax=Cloeon dipterum TaxID=197152 RepID=A0A8S1E6Q5_9INSE|nr:Hypothetical predicted protein [Cloeon dipterum]